MFNSIYVWPTILLEYPKICFIPRMMMMMMMIPSLVVEPVQHMIMENSTEMKACPFWPMAKAAGALYLYIYENEVFDVKHSIALVINCLCVLPINHYFHETYWIWLKHRRHAFSHIRRLLIYWFSLSYWRLSAWHTFLANVDNLRHCPVLFPRA